MSANFRRKGKVGRLLRRSKGKNEEEKGGMRDMENFHYLWAGMVIQLFFSFETQFYKVGSIQDDLKSNQNITINYLNNIINVFASSTLDFEDKLF